MLRPMKVAVAPVWLALAFVIALLSSACAEANPCSLGGSPSKNAASTSGCVGRTVADARALAADRRVVLRVIGEDGERVGQEADARSDRINVYLEDGVVRDADAC